MPVPFFVAAARHAVNTCPGRLRFGLLLCALLSTTTSANATTVVYYPRTEVDADTRNDYPVHLLELALRKSGRDYAVAPSRSVMLQGRAVVELARGSADLTVLWTMTDIERERILRPIRIPIYKGLIGWRLALLDRSRQNLFAGVRKTAHITPWIAGQGHDWPDLVILQANGLRVEGVASYLGLFSMLAKGRIDYFPRSLVEVWAEAESHAAEGVVVDPHIALHYPTASYFFVNKANRALAEDLNRGLELAIQDGSFDALFNQYHGPLIRRANLRNRRVIELRNPLLPPETPLERPELWLHGTPGEATAQR